MAIKRFALGFAVGYVLGARAGRERYEQIKKVWNRFAGNPAVQSIAEKGKDVATGAGRRGMSVVSSGVQRVGSSVKDRLSGERTDGFATGETSL